jgi:hypothetical protein
LHRTRAIDTTEIMKTWLTVVIACAAGCATANDELADAEAEDAAALEISVPEIARFTGVYRWSYATRPYWANDIPSLQLDGGGYVRSRCYGWDCDKLVPQTGGVTWVRSSTGNTYVRFLSFEMVESGEEWLEEPVVADVYEIRTTSGGIKLRKTYSNRWFYLRHTAPDAACDASGGEWTDGACACPEIDGADWSHNIQFVPGLGGCFEIQAASEDGCMETHGSYLDDDRSAIGTWCLCPAGTYETTAGCQPL